LAQAILDQSWFFSLSFRDDQRAMGAKHSISKDDIHSIAEFSQKDISKLYARFRAIDTDNSGQIDISELTEVPELAENPLVGRVMSVFDKDRNGQLSFVELLIGLASVAGALEDDIKLEFAFAIYDIDRDGYISNGDLFQVLKTMVGDGLSDVQMQQLVDRQIVKADQDGDGKLSLKEFKDAANQFGDTFRIDLGIGGSY